MHRSAPGLPASDRPPAAHHENRHRQIRRDVLAPSRTAMPRSIAARPRASFRRAIASTAATRSGRSRLVFSGRRRGRRPPRPALKTIRAPRDRRDSDALRCCGASGRAGCRPERGVDALAVHAGEGERDVTGPANGDDRRPLRADRVEYRSDVSASVSIKYGPSTTLDSPMPRRSSRDDATRSRKAPRSARSRSRALVEIRAATPPRHPPYRRRTPRCARRHPTKTALKLVILYKVGNTPGRFVRRRKDDSTNYGSQT